MTEIAYVNGRFMPLREASVSVLDRGFLFADGIYEVTSVIDGGLIDSEPHMQRLERSLREVRLAAPVTRAELVALQLELVQRNALREGLVYMQVTRGAAPRDFSFPGGDVKPTLVMFVQARSLIDAPAARSGIAVKTVPDIRWQRRDIKSVAMLAQVLAKQAAAEAGCQEAWMVENDVVTEGGSSSAFIIDRAGNIVSRPLSNAILPGVTRKSVLALMAEKGLVFDERPFTVAESHESAEAFITSASSLVMPVVRIDGRPVADGKPGPLTLRLRELYVEHARQTAIRTA